METHIPESDLKNPAVQRMNAVIKTCVHCGFCLPACPTYLETGSELDSPRGRIYLMKGVLEGILPLNETLVGHIDKCLGCLGCVTACPSGVRYDELIDTFRPKLEAEFQRTPLDRFTRSLLTEVLPYPERFRMAVALGKIGKPFKRLMPKPIQAMLNLLPTGTLPKAQPLPEVTPAQGPRRARVALLAGCVQQVLDPEINLATIRVLSRNGIEVLVPKGQGCCGALSLHMGQQNTAREFARKVISAFPGDVDAILTNAAGCGSALKEYAHLFADAPAYAEKSRDFVSHTQDVSQFLAGIGLSSPIPALTRPLKVAYHDACHLGHAQGVRAQPRALLAAIPGLKLVEVPESDICCGSAGVFNITQPEMSSDLLKRKVENILSTGADLVVTGNIGCMTQIQRGLAERGSLRIVHIMQLLDAAYAHLT